MAVRTTALLLALLGMCAALFPALSAPAVAQEGNDPVVLRSMNIVTVIDNAYAVTEISQEFENTDDDAAEAFFSVMIPDRAFISNFSLTLDGSTYYADVLTKDEAEEKYKESVASGKNAGLGETRDSKWFSFSVNLKAEQEASVALRYEHYIPLFLGERRYELFLSALDVTAAEFSVDIDISSAPGLAGYTVENYESSITEEWDTSHNVVLSMEGEDFTPDNDLTVVYRESPVPVNGSLLGHYDSDSEDYYFMNIFSPQESDVGGSISKDIIFVLDKSGSMSKDNKITQMKEAFEEIINQLPDDDRFDIIMFGTDIDLYKPDLIHANESNRGEALEYLDGIGAGGGTNLYDGLEKALDMLTYSEARAPIIVMLTDGNANEGQYTASVPIREHIEGNNDIYCPIFTLGFGYDTDFDFLSALSLENYAKAQRIHPGEDSGEQILNFYRTISTTLLKDVRIEYPDAAYDYYPQNIQAVYEGSESIIVGKLHLGQLEEAGDSNDTGGTERTFTTAFSANSAGGRQDLNASYTVGENDTGNEFIKRFWTYARIYDIMDGITVKSGSERDQLIEEIEELSIEAHFVTPYTALYLEIDEEEDETGEAKTTENEGDEAEDVVDKGPSPSGDDDDDDVKSASEGAPGFELVAIGAALTLAAAGRKRIGKKQADEKGPGR